MRPFHVRGTERAVLSLKINYDGDLFFTGCQDGTISCWLTENGERLGSYKAGGAVKTLDVTDDSRFLVSGSLEGSVDIFRVEGGGVVGKVSADFRKAKWVEFSLGDRELLVVYQPMISTKRYEVRVLKFAEVLENFSRPGEIEVNEITQHLVDYSGDFRISQASWGFLNESIVLASEDGELILLRYPSFQQVRRLYAHEGEVKQMAFARNFSILATAGRDGCKVFNPENLELLRHFKYEVQMNAVAISPLLNFGKPHLITAGGIPARETARTKFQGFDIHICNLLNEEEVGKILNPNQIGPINALQFFPDGKGFITGEEGGYSRVYKFDKTYWEHEAFN